VVPEVAGEVIRAFMEAIDENDADGT